MSTLWTPSGEHRPDVPNGDPAGDPTGDPEYGPGPTAEEIEEILRSRAELASVPVVDIIANHAVGLWQLALLHLMPDPDPQGVAPEPRLDEARLAIDSLAALVDGLGARLAPHDEALREALTQLRLAYVQVAGGNAGGSGGSDEAGGDDAADGEDTPAP